MSTHQVTNIIDGKPCFAKPLDEILAPLKPGGAIKILSPAEFITNRQVAWFKGVLLPALAQDSGDTVTYWETKLKLAVLPDDFQPEYHSFGKQVMPIIPSINKLGKKKMNLMIEGSVEKCHEWGFTWVTLPDPELRADNLRSLKEKELDQHGDDYYRNHYQCDPLPRQ